MDCMCGSVQMSVKVVDIFLFCFVLFFFVFFCKQILHSTIVFK